MDYLVTGGISFLGRHVVDALLQRPGHVHLVLPTESRSRFEQLRAHWPDPGRVHAVPGGDDTPLLGVDRSWIDARAGSIGHVFHLASPTAPPATSPHEPRQLVEATERALALAVRLGADRFHHLSSIAVAGNHAGWYDETMFDVGQRLATAGEQGCFESEGVVRRCSALPWQIYRPAVVVGHSRTGVKDEVDGPYVLFPLLRRLRDLLPKWTPLLALDLGNTNLVPVDYVAAAVDHLAHQPGTTGGTFHLVDPAPQPVVEVINAFAAAAGAPLLRVALDRRLTSLVPASLPRRAVGRALVSAPGRLAWQQTVGRFGLPWQVVQQLWMPSTVISRRTERALASAGLAVPALGSYAAVLWRYWEQHLDVPEPRVPRLARV